MDHADVRADEAMREQWPGSVAGRRDRVTTGGQAAVDRMSNLNVYTRTRARDDRGFTVVESLTAATILLLVAAGVITVLITTSNWYAHARMRTEANAVANQVMSLILSRNYADIGFNEDATASVPPSLVAIHRTMTWPSSLGQFTVDTAIDASLVASATGLPIKGITVTASPVVQVGGREISVTITRFASETPEDIRGDDATVTVQVQIKMQPAGRTTLENVQESGVRVQLLKAVGSPDPDKATGLWAVTDPNGIATFENVPEVKDAANPGYFLTSDPRFGTDIRPLHFPQRIYPTRMGGSNPVAKYSLEVVRHNTPAVLSIGAFETQGFYGASLVFGRYNWLIEKPYRRVVSANGATRLRVYATPILNTSEMAGRTARTGDIYPATTLLGPYSAEVNDYGIARIEIPWTIDSGIGQSWLVWCRTQARSSQVPNPNPPVLHTMTVNASGGWAVPVDQAELMDQPLASNVAQFTGLGEVDPYNSEVRP